MNVSPRQSVCAEAEGPVGTCETEDIVCIIDADKVVEHLVCACKDPFVLE